MILRSFSMRFFLTLGLSLLSHLAQPLAQAQETSVQEEVRAELRLFLWSTTKAAIETEGANNPAAQNDNGTSAEYFIAKGKEFVSVKCEAQEYSAPVAYQGPRRFQLFRRGDGAANGVGFAPVAEVMLPTGGGRYVLFLDGGAKSPRILLFPCDAGSVAKGQMLLFNATDRGLGVRVGTEQKTMAPNALMKFSVASFTDYQMPLEVFEKDKDSWRKCVSTRRAILFDDRNLGVLYQRANDKKVAFALLPTLAWEAKEP